MVKISLRGLVKVASDIVDGVFLEISSAFTEGAPEDWGLYDAVS